MGGSRFLKQNVHPQNCHHFFLLAGLPKVSEHPLQIRSVLPSTFTTKPSLTEWPQTAHSRGLGLIMTGSKAASAPPVRLCATYMSSFSATSLFGSHLRDSKKARSAPSQSDCSSKTAPWPRWARATSAAPTCGLGSLMLEYISRASWTCPARSRAWPASSANLGFVGSISRPLARNSRASANRSSFTIKNPK